LAFYYASSRFIPTWAAAGTTVLASVWSIPNYPAAMPSWYTMFFATFGVAALFRYLETLRGRWLLIAGLCGGFAFIIKFSGLYFVAGALLFILFRGAGKSRPAAVARRSNYGFVLFVFTPVLVYEILLLNLILKSGGVVAVGYFFIPGLLIGAAVLSKSIRRMNWGDICLRLIFTEIGIFSLGMLLPILLFLVPYTSSGFFDLVRGVFVLPQKRFAYATFTVSKLRFFGGLAVDTALLVALSWKRATPRKWLPFIFLGSLPLVLLLARVVPDVFRATWSLFWCLVPVLTVVGVFTLFKRASSLDAIREQELFLALAIMVNCSLVQFPYTSAEYFLYIAPLVLLTTVAVVSQYPLSRRLIWAGFGFSLLFMIVDCTPGWILSLGDVSRPDIQKATLTIPIARGLRVDPASAGVYEKLGQIIQKHARGRYILATPDCPEVYVLYGFQNPTRTLWDFMDDPTDRTNRILATIKERDINLVVLRRNPFASGPIPADLEAAVDKEFPHHQQVWFFDVRWQE